MNKYRVVISVVKGDMMLTDVYIIPCSNMFEVMQKASRYAGFQMDEEGADYIKHISVNLHEEGKDE